MCQRAMPCGAAYVVDWLGVLFDASILCKCMPKTMYCGQPRSNVHVRVAIDTVQWLRQAWGVVEVI